LINQTLVFKWQNKLGPNSRSTTGMFARCKGTKM